MAGWGREEERDLLVGREIALIFPSGGGPGVKEASVLGDEGESVVWRQSGAAGDPGGMKRGWEFSFLSPPLPEDKGTSRRRQSKQGKVTTALQSPKSTAQLFTKDSVWLPGLLLFCFHCT